MKKIKINSDVLINVLDPLQAVINPNHIVPILQCVKIDITEKEIQVTGDNHEVRCKNSEILKSEVEVAFCVNYSMLLAALRTIKNQEITIKVDSKMMSIIHAQGDFEIPLEDATLFPDAKGEKLKLKAEVSAKALKKTLKIANKFVINDDLEPMSNLSIEIGKKIIIRSTNRISLFQETIKGGGDEAHILISGKTSTAIHSLMEEEEDLIQLKYNSNTIFFKFGKKEVSAIQQAGNFPVQVFNKIIETIESATKIELDKDKLLTSIRRVSTLSSKEKVQTVKLIFTKDNLNLSCDNLNSSSKVQEDLPIKTEKEFTIGFNSKLLVEVLSVFEKNAEFGIGQQNMFCINEKKRKGLIAPVLLQQ
jgi:DNA polymerase III sliding clamp (beta) subunit (PCNA family)